MYKGIKILDLSRILVGPYATMILADMGAQVIKIESFDGDETRKWGPPYFQNHSTYFLSINRNKQSICVDLKKGKEFIYKLATQSDVLVENFSTGVMSKLGLDYETISKLNPKIVYASVNGFGSKGVQAKEPGFDYIMQAETGLMHITGSQNSDPTKVGVAIVDVLTGLNLVNGIQAALYQRQQTGKGCHVQTSLYESAIASLANVSSMYINGGIDMKRMGNQHPSISPYGTFKIKDTYIVIGVAQDNQFESLCKVLQLEELLPKFKENKTRVIYRDELQKIIEQSLLKWDVQELIKELKSHKIPVGEVKSVGQCLESQQVKDLQMVHKLQNGQKVIRNPVSFNDHILTNFESAPSLNEHRDSICTQMGLSKDEIQSLIMNKILK